MSLIQIDQLAVWAGDQRLLAPLGFRLDRGERLTILGQTGAGKSLLTQAIMGNLPRALSASGEVRLFNSPVEAGQRRLLWGRQLSLLPQEPWNALDPLASAHRQLATTYQRVGGQPRPLARQRAADVLTQLGLGDSGHKRVDQLSGGMAQRVAISCALAGGAPLLLADEPTKGLDQSRRDQVVQQLIDQSRQGALITITHDVAVARQIGGTLMVMKAGEVVESGDCTQVLTQPRDDYTRQLIAADPDSWPTPTGIEDRSASAVLETRQLAIGRGGHTLARDLTFTLQAGEVVGVVGDSGCGKSTLGDTLLGLNPVHRGQILRHTKADSYRWQKLYQDPTAAVSRAAPLRTLLEDLVRRHGVDRDGIAPLMARLGLSEALLTRRADSVSGGELQRFCLLRALLLKPVFLFADEPTSRLDPITAQSVSQLLVEVARETGCALMLVSHDPQLIAKRCDRVIQLAGG